VLLLSKLDRSFYEQFVICHFVISSVDGRMLRDQTVRDAAHITADTDRKQDVKTDSSGKLTFASVANAGISGATDAKCLLYAKRFLHYVYKHAIDKDIVAVTDDILSSGSSGSGLSTRAFLRESMYTAAVEGLRVVSGIKPAFGVGSVGSSKSNNRPHTEGGGVGRSQCMRIAALLEVIGAIVDGWAFGPISVDGVGVAEMHRSMRSLLRYVVLPLHAPNEMEEWRDQTPLIQAYHEPLVVCISKLVTAERRLAADLKGVGTATSDSQSHKRDFSQVQRPGEPVSGTRGPDTILVSAIKGLLKQWPTGFTANTPKEVLFLHELDTLICLSSPDEFEALLTPLLTRISYGLSHDNTRPIQRTLQFFKNKAFLALCSPHLEAIYTTLLPILYRSGELFWNPTVNKLTGLALRKLKELDLEVFTRVADRVIKLQAVGLNSSECKGNGTVNTTMSTVQPRASAPPLMLPAGPRVAKTAPRVLGGAAIPMGKSVTGAPRGFNPATVMPGAGAATSIGMGAATSIGMGAATSIGMGATTSIGMGATTSIGMGAARSMLPPKMAVGSTGKMFPVGAKAVGNGESGGRFALPPRNTGSGGGGLMPAELTGVAPWARAAGVSVEQEQSSPPMTSAGSTLLEDFISLCIPDSTNGDAADGPSQWSELQAASTPTLLPSLRFHDLVFGKELGKGAFSTVKYSRQIVREKSNALWPEFAVKVVPLTVDGNSSGGDSDSKCAKQAESNVFLSTSTSSDAKSGPSAFDYTKSISREIATLRILCHPGISRLISCFRYAASAYLVLEYASRGDLHSYILASRDSMASSGANGGVNGLSLLHTRFILGEILAALHYVHSEGFIFCDLKPENVLITAMGHIKLTDFGACRPCTRVAYLNLRHSAKLLTQLRDGDWRATYSSDTDSKSEAKFGPGAKPVATAWGAETETDVEASSFIENEEAVVNDHHVEGTLSYLPPEILVTLASDPALSLQGPPDGPLFEPLTDSWSLGCVAYFCIVGRPLIFGDTADDILYQQKKLGLCADIGITTAAVDMGPGCSDIGLGLRFGEGRAQSIEMFPPEMSRAIDNKAACGFVSALLSPRRSNRLTILAAVDHCFISTGTGTGTGNNSGHIAADMVSESLSSTEVESEREDSENGVSMQPLGLHFRSPPLVDLPLREADHVSTFDIQYPCVYCALVFILV